MKELLEKVGRKEDLSLKDMEDFVQQAVSGEVNEAQLAAFLYGLRVKGETVTERVGLAQAMQARALKIPTQRQAAMDNCGTGGDQANTFNVSTTAAFVLAGGGIEMAKHGNRSISSRSGSADVLEALGIRLDLSPEELGEVFDRVGMVFLFSRNLHPANHYLMPARVSLGIPTILNLTGPFINPVPLKTQLLGISRPDMLQASAEILRDLGRERAIIVTGQGGLDEASLHGRTDIALLSQGRIHLESYQAEELGLEPYPLGSIQGGSARENAAILLSVLNNQASPYLEMTVLNAGLGFYANGLVQTLPAGLDLARQVIADGQAAKKLRQLQEYQR